MRPEPAALLAHYDLHARALPWRVPPASRAAGAQPDPYRVWLSEIMLQQTTTVHAGPYFERFTSLWPTVEALAEAPREAVLAEWAGLGYYARARNLYACARSVADRGGFPSTEAGLRELPGVGPYTAAAVAAIAFDAPALPVDGNVERLVARLFCVETPLPHAKPRIRELAASLAAPDRHGDYAQALMDLGATICRPRRPNCGCCPWASACVARAKGVAETLPRRTEKAPKPVRFGVAFVAITPDGTVLVETRPDKGLLGGLSGPPTTDWSVEEPDATAIAAQEPVDAMWFDAGEAQHAFTHFSLRLRVRAASVDVQARPRRGRFVALSEARRAAPTALRKALDLGSARTAR